MPVLVVPRVLCFLLYEEDVLLLYGASDKPLWASRYNGIGGHVESGEDIYSAARREIEEEAGIPFADLRLRGVVHVAPEGDEPPVMMFVFTAQALSPFVRSSPEGTPVWVPQDMVGTLEGVVGDVPVLLEWALNMQPDDPPFSAYSTRDEKGQILLTRGD